MAKSTTFKGQAKPFGKSGHFNEPRRHSLQAKGIKTGRNTTHPLDYVGAKPKPKGRMVVQKFRVYKFDELPKEAQEKALETYREINVNYDWWDSDGWLELSQKEMDDAGITMSEYEGGTIYEWKQMWFDIDRGSYVQFDQLSVKRDNLFRKFLGVPESTWKKVSYRFDNSSRERNTKLEFYDEEGMNHYSSDQLKPDEVEILNNAQEKWNDKCEQVIKDLRDTYYDALSDEQVAESFRANEYEFTENGKIF